MTKTAKWKLVPTEPTEEMLVAGLGAAMSDLSEGNLIYSDKGGAVHYKGQAEYEAMVKAAPECDLLSSLIHDVKKIIRETLDAPTLIDLKANNKNLTHALQEIERLVS